MCKLEHYGNCDPETKDKEYCIFHKPNKTEKEAQEFWDKIIKNFQPEIQKETVKGLDTELTIPILVFGNEANFEGYVFPRRYKYKVYINMVFEKAAFLDGANFSHCIFESSMSFDKATFCGVTFRGAEFKSTAGFIGARFLPIPEPGGQTVTDFSYARFKGPVYFTDAHFETPLRLEGVVFEGISDWGRSLEEDVATITSTVPGVKSEFYRALRMNYERIGLHDDADRVYALEMRYRRLDRKQLELKKANSFKKEGMAVIFRLKQYRLLNKKYPPLPFFFRGFLYMMSMFLRYFYVYSLAWIKNILEYIVADLTCKYGTSWQRPIILWITMVLGIFPLLYIVPSILGHTTISTLKHSTFSLTNLFSILYFSIITATTLGYGNLHPIGFGRFIASLEAVFGAFMWAVFITVFARKYMRR